MTIRPLLSLSLLAGAGAGTADLDQIDPTSTLDSTLIFGAMQIFPNDPDYSATIVEDFVSAGIVTDVAVAFDLFNPGLFGTLPSRVTGWRISLWASLTDAATSGNDLAGNTIATTFVPSSSPNITYSTISGTRLPWAFRVDISGLNLVTQPNQLVWIGMAPEMDSAEHTWSFILSNTDPANRGGGQAANSRGINPGRGFNYGSLIDGPYTDAAYRVTSVPEPATLFALAAGLGALALRRRAR